MNALVLLDYLGVALFAATGALAASRKELDVVGFVFLAAVTGIGGGTARDIILGVDVFWIVEPIYVLTCAVTAVVIFFTAHLVESRYRWLLWLDALALSAYCVLGAAKGLAASGSPIVAIVMGMLTGTFGGILRDVLAHEKSVLLRREIYVTAALLGSTAYVAAMLLGAGSVVSALAGFAATIAIRGGALWFGWTLPTYRSRPGRSM